MEKVIVAAVARDRSIGSGEGLLWSMPADERFLQETIRGKTALMGRGTYEADGQDWPVKHLLVITRQEGYAKGEAEIVGSIKAAYEKAALLGAEELIILGGGKVYQQTLKDADTLILTEIDAAFEAPVRFPKIDPKTWKEVRRDAHPADAENPYPYAFVTYRRKSQG